jgi:hypothetical protein
MPEFCTCGAQLVPDSLFCHKCGKPQREIVVPELELPPPAAEVPVAPPAPQARPVNIHNGVAMRIALLAAGFATLLSFLPYLNWLGAGFFAAFLYRRRTGQLLSLESGVRLGWITGVMMFGIMALLITGSMLFLQAAGGLTAIQSEFKSAMDPRMIEALKMLQSTPEVVKLLIQFFILTNLLGMAGGALAVKMAGRH